MVDQTRRYRLMEPVGHGSFGTVWRAIMETEGGFSKEVALKILRPEAAARLETVRRLRDEARLLGLLRHRSIVQVDGLVQVEGRWAVVMELVPGASLNEVLERSRMPLTVALEVTAEIASALHDAYWQTGPDARPLHLIHRDIKPSNIRLTASGGVKVLDFGIARADFSAREASTSSLMLGTLAYMAPERLDSIDGPEGDIYALGAMFYELILGERIGKTSSNPMRHAQLHSAATERLAGALGEGAAEVVELFGRAIAYEPRDRPTARDLEIACRRIGRRTEGESLAEWAAREVPLAAEHAEIQLEPDDTELTGMTLMEDHAASTRLLGGSVTEPLAEPTDQSLTILEPQVDVLPAAPPPLARRRTGPSTWIVMGVGVAAMLLGALLGAGVLALRRPLAPTPAPSVRPTAPVVAPATPAPPVAEPPPPSEPAAAPGTEAPPEELPLAAPVPRDPAPAAPPVTATAPRPEPTPPVEEPPVEAPPEQPAHGLVRVRGATDGVELRGRDGVSHAPGELAPGTYDVFARFGGETAIRAGQVQVQEGTTIELACDAAFLRCQAL